MSISDRTRWRSHVGLPADVIQDAAKLAMIKKEKRIPRTNDSHVKPKIIYVSRNQSVREDTYRSELFIPKRSPSYESVVGQEKIEVSLKENISFVNGGLNVASNVGFMPIKSFDDTPHHLTQLPDSSPPPLIPAITPTSSVSSSPPPPPLPTSSPPPLDDEDSTCDLPPPPPPSIASLPPIQPSPTLSFHGNHINLAGSKNSGQEDEILRYLDISIAKENIVISESTQSINDVINQKKGNNSTSRAEKDTYLITKWDGKKAKTVRAFIKPGTVEELKELFQRLGQTYNNNSAIERRKARRLLSKRTRNDVKLQNIKFIQNEQAPLIMKAKYKTDSTQSDNSTTTATADSESSTLSEQSESISSSKENINLATPINNVTQLEINTTSSNVDNNITMNFPCYESNDYRKSTMDDGNKSDLSTTNNDLNIYNTSLHNAVLSESGRISQLNASNHAYVGQRVFGVTSSNASGELPGSYTNVWASSFDMNTSEKSKDDTNEWFNEEETPVLSISKTNPDNEKRHSQNISFEKSDVMDVNMEKETSEQVKPDENTRITEVTEVTENVIRKTSSASSSSESRNLAKDDKTRTITPKVTENRVRKTSSASSSSNSSCSTADDKLDVCHGSETTYPEDIEKNRPTSPKENYDNLITELKRQTSTKVSHVTAANVSKTHSRASSAKFSVDADGDNTGERNSSDENEQSYNLVDGDDITPKENYNNILSEFKSLFMKNNLGDNSEKKLEEMPVVSGHEDFVSHFDVKSLDLSNIGDIKRSAPSNRSDLSDMAASSSSQRSSRSMRSSSSNRSSFASGNASGNVSGDLLMVKGADGNVYVVEDVTDAKRKESFRSCSSSGSSKRSQSGTGHFQIGSTGSVRIDSKVDDATAGQVISALYDLNADNNYVVTGDANNNSMNQKIVSLRSSGSSDFGNYGVISLPENVSKDDTEESNVTQDVKEHETVTIHGVTSDNVALIEHRVQKTITRHKDAEDSTSSVSSSIDNEQTMDTGAVDYSSIIGYNQRNASYNQPILVTMQNTPSIDLTNSATKAYNAAVLAPQDATTISTYQFGNLAQPAMTVYSTGNLVTPSTSTLNFNNSAFQPYNPVPSTNGISVITDKYVGTTTEYTLGDNVIQTNYVKTLEPTEDSYKQVQPLLSNFDQVRPTEDHVTTISNTKSDKSGRNEDQDNELKYYSKKTTTTTIIPPYEVDSVYDSKSSRTTSEESPRDDDGPMYRIVRASMSPRRSLSPKHHTIYHEVEPKRRSQSSPRHPGYRDVDRSSRSDVFRSERYMDNSGSEPRFSKSTYKSYLDNDFDFVDNSRKIKVVKTYASNDDLSNRRKSSGFISSDSESDRNVTRLNVKDNSYSNFNFTPNHHKRGYESDDEVNRLYRVSTHGQSGVYQNGRSESVMSDDQLYRAKRFESSLANRDHQQRSSRGHYHRSRSPSPDQHHRYKVVHTGPSDSFGSHQKMSSYSASRLDSGYFEPEYTTRTTRVLPSRKSTALSPTRNSTIIKLNRHNESGVTSPVRNESHYKVINVKSTTTDDNMRRSRGRRRSRSSSDSSNSGDETRRVKTLSTKHSLTSPFNENGTSHKDSKVYIQRSFSPTPVNDSYRVSSKYRSQEPVYRARSPSPLGRHRTTVDVRRDYTDKLFRSVNDIREGDTKSYVVYNTKSTERPRERERERPRRTESDIITTEKSYRMRSPTPTNNLTYRSFTNDLPNGFGPTHGVPNGDGGIHSSYQTTGRSYKMSNQPQVVESSEDKDLKVVRGSILIKNKIDTSKDEDDFDDNVNVFDNYFHLQKDNPLYQSDPDIYKSFEEETIKKSSLGDAFNQDITFETVERIAKQHAHENQVSKSSPKKQNLSQLLLSKLDKIDSKDIRIHIDVKHTKEDIFGDIEFVNADGTSAASDSTKNFDSVSENVDLTLRDGKAFVIITVNAERIVPIDYEFKVWRKSAAIVTRQIEIDLFANDQRRRLYQHVMETTGTQGAIDDGSFVRRNSRTGEDEKVLNSMQTLKLFTEILDVADGEGDYDEMSVKTRQLQGNGQLPVSEEIDFLY